MGMCDLTEIGDKLIDSQLPLCETEDWIDWVSQMQV